MNLANLFRLLTKRAISKSIDWWVEIKTTNPNCIYYFGPFQCKDEAKAYYPGYIEDLVAEGAENFEIHIKRCLPDSLTYCDE
jgi:hypothetical protein